LGNTVKIEDAYDHVFGLVLLNDWSGKFMFPIARDETDT
jgi:2-keto-4-pentenoate hydratase/2-oxohepta-3-ene-1,7-dioic acid hydratase in catechol pathway